MQKAKTAVTLPTVLLTSCTSTPELPSQYAVSIADVVNNARCELRYASAKSLFLTEKKGWSAGVDLQLTVCATAGFDASASLTDPLKPQRFAFTI